MKNFEVYNFLSIFNFKNMLQKKKINKENSDNESV